jgi:hypothetical protein
MTDITVNKLTTDWQCMIDCMPVVVRCRKLAGNLSNWVGNENTF